MRPGTFDTTRIRARAKREYADTLLTWWKEKFIASSTPQDLKRQNRADMFKDYLLDAMRRRDEIAALLAEGPSKDMARWSTEMAKLERFIDGRRTDDIVTGDALVDKWEAELAAGRIPDLTEGLKK